MKIVGNTSCLAILQIEDYRLVFFAREGSVLHLHSVLFRHVVPIACHFIIVPNGLHNASLVTVIDGIGEEFIQWPNNG